MTDSKENLTALAADAFRDGTLKKIVFSKPKGTGTLKISCKPVKIGAGNFLHAESFLPGDTVSQKNVADADLKAFLSEAAESYLQINLLTANGDAEVRTSKSGKIAVLGVESVRARAMRSVAKSEVAFDEIDRKKNYILTGSEPFLKALGISDKEGRIHDKKQPKFRQINRFLEYLADEKQEFEGKDFLSVYDLCCGKSYLSFAVYHYLTQILGKKVEMLCVDLKRDVLLACEKDAKALGFVGMKFLCADIHDVPAGVAPDLVISLHACDVATDVVLDVAIARGAKVILSTPCCHRYLSTLIRDGAYSFVTKEGKLADKFCESVTDGLRILRLCAAGYAAHACELTNPDDTPKNTLIRAVKRQKSDEGATLRYREALLRVLGDNAKTYAKTIGNGDLFND